MKRLLLHACCGPCAIYVAKKLSSFAFQALEDRSEDYQVTLFFYNPNIWPEQEYQKRLATVKKIADSENFNLIEGKYNQADWLEAVKGLENELEGGARCPICFKFRLEETAKCAKENNYQYFASTLTSGRNKKAEIINPLGESIAKKYSLTFVAGDWKKQGGQEQSHKLAEELGLYRQSYCGCKFSLRISH